MHVCLASIYKVTNVYIKVASTKASHCSTSAYVILLAADLNIKQIISRTGNHPNILRKGCNRKSKRTLAVVGEEEGDGQ